MPARQALCPPSHLPSLALLSMMSVNNVLVWDYDSLHGSLKLLHTWYFSGSEFWNFLSLSSPCYHRLTESWLVWTCDFPLALNRKNTCYFLSIQDQLLILFYHSPSSGAQPGRGFFSFAFFIWLQLVPVWHWGWRSQHGLQNTLHHLSHPCLLSSGRFLNHFFH